MKILIDFPYDTIDNLALVLHEPNISKEEFIQDIYDDLWGNYLFSFFQEPEYHIFDPLYIEKIKNLETR